MNFRPIRGFQTKTLEALPLCGSGRHAVGIPYRRPAMTMLEVVAALGLLSIAMLFLAQVALGELTERRRQISRLQVLEAATNILESARATPVESLTPDWAAGQKLPEQLVQRLVDGKLKVAVEPYAKSPKIKRVTVQITWLNDAGSPPMPVVLTGFFGPRSASQTEGKP